MKKEELCYMSACEMADKIRSQELTSLEITETIIERIEKINPIINAYCTPTFQLARDMATIADKAVKTSRNGENLGLLHGIPTSIKDLETTKGIRTTLGCKIYENFIPKRDSIIVKRIKDAGAIILGKTNTPSLGYKGVTDNLIFGVTKNPWNLEKTCGGSSGGAAAAVASGLGPLASGSDGGGSIRIPSSFCGVYGFKPNFGRVPHEDMKVVGSLGTLEHKGPIVRCVEDAALMLDVLTGEHYLDRYSLPKPNYSYLEKLYELPHYVKIGFSFDLGFAKALDSEVKKAVMKGIEKFEKFNWLIEKSDIKLQEALNTHWILWTTSFAHRLKPYLDQWKDKLDPQLIEVVKIGLNYSVDNIKWAEIQREMVYEEISRFFNNFDILITPTLACSSFNWDLQFPNIIDGKEVSAGAWLPFTYPFNLSGHPAASIPCGWSDEGVPIGMQIVGKRLDELLVLQVSKAFEEIAPWQDKKPIFN
ncbi:MAG: amidase [Candidatus Thorarchaeota archaeon]